MNLRPFAFSLLPLLACLAGCATTPASRIDQNRELFDSLPVADQARIRGGQIDLGFTPAMVRIALGEPARSLVRHDPAGDTEIWLYFETVRKYERQRAEIDGLSASGPGGIRSFGGSAWIDVVQEREYLRSRVEFRNGSVAAFEEPPKEEPKP